MIAFVARKPRPPRDASLRQSFTLTEAEQMAFARLCARSRFHDAADVWRFWRSVAQARGLDPASIIGNSVDPDGSFTALPLGHGKHWCWPAPLHVKKPPELVYPVNAEQPA